MQSYSRWRLFATETPVAFDLVAALAIVIAVDVGSSLPRWIEYVITAAIWATCVGATSYYRARAELEAERLAELHERQPAVAPRG